MASKIELLLEAERRGILPPDKKAILNEARKRGLVREISQPLRPAPSAAFTGITSGLEAAAQKSGTVGISAPSMIERFKAGFAQKEIPQPKGFEMGDVAEFVGREGLPAIGATIGAIKGFPALGVGAIPGAGIGAAGGRALQKGIARATGIAPDETIGAAAKDVAMTGVTQAAGQKVFQVATPAAHAAYNFLKPKMVALGAQLLRLGPGIKEQVGKAVLSDLQLLSRAPSVKDAGILFEKTISNAGLKNGPAAAKLVTGKQIVGSGEKLNLLNKSLDEITKGTLKTQDAIVAREQTAKLLQSAKFGDPAMAAEKRELTLALNQLDDFLEPKVPGYADARRAYHEAKAADEFRSLLPRNKNLSPNVLRSTAALGAAGTGIALGQPQAALLPLAISPLVAGAGIRLLGLSEKALKAALKSQLPQTGVRMGIGGISNAVTSMESDVPPLRLRDLQSSGLAR